MVAAGLVGLAALSLSSISAFADEIDNNGQNGTTLITSVTAATERIREHRWTISKAASASGLDMFRGDSAAVTYTIGATDTGTVDRAFVKGEVTVNNGGEVYTADLGITVVISTVGPGATSVASGRVSVDAKPMLAPGETFSYPYSVEVPNAVVGRTYKATAEIRISNHSGAVGFLEGPSPSETTVMTSAIREVNAAVDVDDSNGQTFAFSASGVRTYARTFACDADAGEHVNTATLRQTGASARATVTVRCFALSVTTGANTRFTRTYAWSITKSADHGQVALEPDGSSESVGYVVGLSSTSADSAWAVAGQITVTNPAPIAAPLSSVTATLPAGPADVVCGGASVPAGSSLSCTYDRTLSGAAATTVTATATMPNLPSGSTAYTESAGVDFATAAVTEIDRTVAVSDTANGGARSLGTVAAGGAGGPASSTRRRSGRTRAAARTPSPTRRRSAAPAARPAARA